MLERIAKLFTAKPPNCKWYKKIGGQMFCYNGDAEEIRRCFDEHESESLLLYEINEVSEKELLRIIAEIKNARNEFENFLQFQSNNDVRNQ